MASNNPNSWQMDLAFWEKRPILTAVNINSRLGYAKLLTNETAATVLAGVKALTRVHKVDILTSDNGSEFMNKQTQVFFKAKKIEHFNNEPGDHGTMGKIERFNRTLKQRLAKISPKRLTQKLIADVIENYNSTVHRSIGMTPNEAKWEVIESELTHNQGEAERIENEFEPGSNVLYRLKKKTFNKEAARWSKAVYSVVRMDGYRVQIKSKNGHTHYKAPNDLKMVQTETTDATINRGDILEAEKILEHKKMRNKKYKYLIKWIGNEPDSWEPQDNFRLINKNRRSTLEKEYWAPKSTERELHPAPKNKTSSA